MLQIMYLNDNNVMIIITVAVGAHEAHETPGPTTRERSERLSTETLEFAAALTVQLSLAPGAGF